ncbi:MAG: hypothetical protein JSV88_04780 [Candidatus Aminicenantes bacterium]|nr:MAG: hypothetical protein JSV88_04780 [Candidatus Aminicenantes bacterium]
MAMNNHNNQLPDYREIIKYERKIVDLLNHNIHQYKYVGEEGKEYEVIQSLFYEINQLRELSNRQIRWYAVIINLVMNFYHQRIGMKNRGCFLDFSLVEDGFNLSIPGCTAGESFKFTTHIEKSKSEKLAAPPYIGLIESYITELARLGLLASTKEEINPDYLDYKLERIHALLTELLKDMDSQMTGETREEVFILTIKNAADNMIKLGKPLLKKEKPRFTGCPDSEIYQKLIIGRIQRLDKETLANYYNMEAFWNGFIP